MTQNQVRYLLVKEEVCPRCKGDAVIEHPAWQQYFDEYWTPFVEKHERLPTDEQTETWWSEMGFGPKEIPPQEVKCHVCNGTGVVYTGVVSVDDAFRALVVTPGVVVSKPEGGAV
jgi:rRNA maturation protein Nop10